MKRARWQDCRFVDVEARVADGDEDEDEDEDEDDQGASANLSLQDRRLAAD
jgi:hypothetical protein